MEHSNIIRRPVKWLMVVLYQYVLGLSRLLKKVVTIVLQSALLLALILMVMGPLVWWLTVPIPTRIQADIIVDHVSFRVNAPTEFKQPIKFHSATFRDFEYMQFTPGAIAAKKLKRLKTMHIKGKDDRFFPTVRLKTITPDTMQFGVLHKLIIAASAKVALKIQEVEKDYEELGIVIENDLGTPTTPSAPVAILRHRGSFKVMTRHCKINDIKKLAKNFEIEKLSRRNPAIEVGGQIETLRIMLSVPASQNFEIVPSGLPISSLDLFGDNIVMGQKAVITAVKQGIIRYPAYPDIESVSFKTSNFVFFGKAEDFKIDRITYDPDNRGLKVRLNGIAEHPVMIHPQNFEAQENKKSHRDYRLTRLDTIAKASKFHQMIFDILTWLIPIIMSLVGIVILNVSPRRNPNRSHQN